MATEPLSAAPPSPPPLPNGDPATFVYVADLPLPAEQARAIADRYRPWWWRWFRGPLRRQEEFMARLQYQFPGMSVALTNTPRGPLVMLVGRYSSDEFTVFLEALRQRGERSKVVVWPVPDPKDETTWT